MSKNLFQVIVEEIDATEEGLKQQMVRGGAHDYASYREMVGLYRGLESIKNYVQDLSRNYTEHDND